MRDVDLDRGGGRKGMEGKNQNKMQHYDDAAPDEFVARESFITINVTFMAEICLRSTYIKHIFMVHIHETYVGLKLTS